MNNEFRPTLPHTCPPPWREIGRRFPETRACLASFLAMESAEIIEGVKPANLVNLVNREQPCGRNIYYLWDMWGEDLLEGSGLTGTLLRRDASSQLLMIYDRAALTALLDDRRVKRMLQRAGHHPDGEPDGIIEEFRRRICEGGFPHEIGILLGYPLKDVAGFMGWIRTPFTCQGPWKIYGNPQPSLQLAELHRDCRNRMAWRIAGTDNPISCLRASRLDKPHAEARSMMKRASAMPIAVGG